jgi:hypothetical protein
MVLVIAQAPRARAATRTTLSAYADREGVVLESPWPNAASESQWERVCLLPCEGLYLDTWAPYRVAGPLILPSEPFQLLPTEDSQVLRVHARTLADRRSASTLLIAGLTTLGVGALLVIPGAVLTSGGCSTDSQSPCTLTAGLLLVGIGGLVALVGLVLATVGGVGLANCNTSVTIAAKPGVAR